MATRHNAIRSQGIVPYPLDTVVRLERAERSRATINSPSGHNDHHRSDPNSEGMYGLELRPCIA